MKGNKKIPEKNLVKLAEDLGDIQKEQLEFPKYCPIIYVENKVTGGIDGIRLK